MIKRLLIAVAFATLFVACKPKQPETPKLSVTGSWELSSVATKVAVAGEEVSVFLSFTDEGAFTLYQKIGLGRYTVFTGTYEIDQDLKQISGVYSNKKNWGPYDLEATDNSITLSFVDGSESDTYTRIDSIPSAVTENTY